MQYTTNLSTEPYPPNQYPSWVESIGIPTAFAHDAIRDILNDEHQQLSEQHLDWILEAIHEQMTPEELLSFAEFLKGLRQKFRRSGRRFKKFGKKALPVVGQVTQIAAPIVGAAIGGPAGAQIGGMVSQGIGALMKNGPGAAKMPAVQKVAANSQLLNPAQPAARQVLGLVQNPAFLQSLLGQVLGGG